MHSRQGKLLNINVICVDYAFHKVIGCRGVAIIPVTIHSSVTRVNSGFNALYVCRDIMHAHTGEKPLKSDTS